MIIQTAPEGIPRRAVMMYEHTALCLQFANAFGNERFACLEPYDAMVFVISNHDAGWLEYDRNPRVDSSTGLPYDLIETPPESIVSTSRLSPEFNQRQNAYCGLISSMHSWGLYNGRYGLSKLVLLDRIAQAERPLVDQMLDGELARQKRLKDELALDSRFISYLGGNKIFQNYKALQFVDTLALYFNRVHPSLRGQQTFEHVPLSEDQDISVTIRPVGDNTYALSPFPLRTQGAEFGFSGRRIVAADGARRGGWPAALAELPTEWETFRLIPG